MTRFSIITINNNSKEIIKQFLDNIINQTYKDFELIIVDNNSTDNSAGIISDYYIENSNIINYLQSAKEEKIPTLYNRALQLCKGEYVTFLKLNSDIPNNYLLRVDQFLRCNDTDLVIPYNKTDKINRYVNKMPIETILQLINIDDFSCRGKFYRKDLIGSNRFLEYKTRFAEDFNIEMFAKSQNKKLMPIDSIKKISNRYERTRKIEPISPYELIDSNENKGITVDEELLQGLKINLFFKSINFPLWLFNKSNVNYLLYTLEIFDKVIPNWQNNIYFKNYVKYLNYNLLKVINNYFARKEINCELKRERKLLRY